MDLNELLFRHQIAVIRHDETRDCAERRRFSVLADGFALRIDALQRSLGAFRVTPLARIAS